MSEQLRVLAIGSCRVFRPLRPHHTDGTINLLNYLSHQWFTHSVLGGMQFAEAITGRRDIPSKIRPMVCETALKLPEDLSGAEHFNPDILFLEVSSLKIFQTGDIILNAHLLRSAMVAAGLDAVSGLRDPSSVDLGSVGIPDVTLRQSSREDFATAVSNILEIFGVPIVLVNHLHVVGTDGMTQLSGRPEITQELNLLASEDARISFFDTREVIEDLGSDRALQDPQHYRPDAERAVGMRLLTAAGNLLRSRES